MMLMLEKGQSIAREAILRKLVEIQYDRAEDLRRGTFRVRGDTIEVYPPYDDFALRVELWGSQIEAIRKIDPLTGEIRSRDGEITRLPIYPKSHYVLPAAQSERAIQTIYEELDWWKGELARQGKIVESQRVVQRTHFDIEMMRTIGYCHGIENYSRHMSGRLPGRSAADAARLRSFRLFAFHRRIAPDRSATSRDVCRRSFAQADAGGLRLSHALGAR